MLVDAHLHCTGRETAADVLRALDEAGVERGVLLAPFLSEGFSLHDGDSLRAANRHLATLVAGHEDRLVGLAVVNPALPLAARDAQEALEGLRLRGLKLVPSGWYPYDDCAHEVYAVAAQARAPILFHSGIFIDGRSGRFCRPAFYEAVRDHPGLRVTLAHLGWPWTDEANALGLIDRINGVLPDQSQFRFDISFGPPPAYREQVLRLALDVLGAPLMQFGSDCFLPCGGQEIARRIGEVRALMDRLDVAPTDRERIFAGTAQAWLHTPAQ
jgi:predicted TIM-barrel fold metal-dependent hydrolase